MDYCDLLVVFLVAFLVVLVLIVFALVVFGRRRGELWSVLDDVVVLADDTDAVPDFDIGHFDDV